jgi:hypothetical protein
MKMIELQPGYGFGIENFRNVFIFDTAAALGDFVNSGWEFGANAMAAAQGGSRAGGDDVPVHAGGRHCRRQHHRRQVLQGRRAELARSGERRPRESSLTWTR